MPRRRELNRIRVMIMFSNHFAVMMYTAKYRNFYLLSKIPRESFANFFISPWTKNWFSFLTFDKCSS